MKVLEWKPLENKLITKQSPKIGFVSLKVYKKATSPLFDLFSLPFPSGAKDLPWEDICPHSGVRRILADPGSVRTLALNFAASRSLRNDRCVLPALYSRHYSSRAIWLRQRLLVINIAPYLQHITMPLFIHQFLSVKPQKTLTILHLLFEPLPSCGIFFALSSSLCLLFWWLLPYFTRPSRSTLKSLPLKIFTNHSPCKRNREPLVLPPVVTVSLSSYFPLMLSKA